MRERPVDKFVDDVERDLEAIERHGGCRACYLDQVDDHTCGYRNQLDPPPKGTP